LRHSPDTRPLQPEVQLPAHERGQPPETSLLRPLPECSKRDALQSPQNLDGAITEAIRPSMSVGQLRVGFIPLWRSFTASCAALLVLSACSDQAETASMHAISAQQLFAENNLPAARSEIISAIAVRDDIVDYHLLRGRIEWGMDS